jgi:L-aspartate oxidase
MSQAIARRRYLSNFQSHRVPHLFTDVLVIGSGVAGLRAALAAAEHCDVLVVTKGAAEDSCTSWAQGGVAAAISSEDSPETHRSDTLSVGCGLGDEAVVDTVVQSAPSMIRQLIDWGANFDQEGGQLAVGREGAHTHARVLHADGDATGREFTRVLLERVRQSPRIRLFEHCYTIDLLSNNGTCIGVVSYHEKYGHQMFWSPSTVLASGGCGRVFRETTNPPVATGDGLAMAYRIGATLRDMEMIQFHPTTLYVAGAARTLISEAVRGEGAYLCHRDGSRFMDRYDQRAELAPRDVVSRAITKEMHEHDVPSIFLDVRHFPEGKFAARFPNLNISCLEVGINPTVDLIPVRPSAHYCIGGVVVDRDAQTSIPGLYAAGEVASSGLHGANRLASNSLLEGLVFGERAGQQAAKRAVETGHVPIDKPLSHLMPQSVRTELDLPDIRHSLRSVMSRNCAVERSADRLRETLEIIEFWTRYTMDKVFDEPAAWEVQNMLTVAACIATAAATRAESRGVHYRTDLPDTLESWRQHIDLRRGDSGMEASTVPA